MEETRTMDSEKVDTGLKHTLHKVSVAIRMIPFAIATALLFVWFRLVKALMDRHRPEVEKVDGE